MQYKLQDKLNSLRERVREVEQPVPGAVESSESLDTKRELEKSLAQLQADERDVKAQINVARMEVMRLRIGRLAIATLTLTSIAQLEDAERERARVQAEVEELSAKRGGIAGAPVACVVVRVSHCRRLVVVAFCRLQPQPRSCARKWTSSIAS